MSERDLERIFRRYGEERFARQIARAIGRRRRKQPFERTGELVDTIKAAIPAPARFGEGHPAKRVFQALRIAVNEELDALEDALPAAVEMLRPGGRLAVISFHSLEDRIVKHWFREEARGCTCPPDFPVCVCGHEPVLRVLTPKPVRPTARETALNPRAASARLRVAEKDAVVAAVAPQPQVRAPAAAPALPRPRPRPRAERRPRVASGVVWIAVIGVLLAGIVFMNVAVLRLNLQLDRVGRDRARLRADNAQLASKLSSAQAAARIQALARKQLGVQPALAQETTYVRLKPKS